MTAQTAPDVLINALRRALRPFVRLMLAKGLGYPQLAELFKELYVDVAENEFRIDGKMQTDSRISLLTGIHRKDVRRLRNLPIADDATPAAVSLGMRLVSAWGLPPYADADGLPQALPRLASRGGEISFEGLVAHVSKDIRARAVLDEWLRLGVVRLDDEDRVELLTAAFVPSQGFDEKAFYFGHNLHDHASAAVHNLIGNGTPFVDRSVHYDALPEDLVRRLARDAENGGMRLLHSLNRKAIADGAAEAVDPARQKRFTFGIYFYATDPQPTPVTAAAERAETSAEAAAR